MRRNDVFCESPFVLKLPSALHTIMSWSMQSQTNVPTATCFLPQTCSFALLISSWVWVYCPTSFLPHVRGLPYHGTWQLPPASQPHTHTQIITIWPWDWSFFSTFIIWPLLISFRNLLYRGLTHTHRPKADHLIQGRSTCSRLHESSRIWPTDITSPWHSFPDSVLLVEELVKKWNSHPVGTFEISKFCIVVNQDEK